MILNYILSKNIFKNPVRNFFPNLHIVLMFLFLKIFEPYITVANAFTDIKNYK